MAENKELADKIQTAVEEMHRLVEREMAEAKANAGEATAETKEALAKVQARIDELELKMQRSKVVKPGEAPEEQKARKAIFYKWVRGGDEALTPEERKALVSDEVGQRLIEPELDAEIERILPKVTVIRNLATVRTIGSDRIKTRSIGGVTVGWGKLETGTEITESTLTPGEPTYQYVEDLYGLTKIGEDELMDSDVNLEAILAEEFARALGEEEDKAFVLGAGHDYNQPEGITKNTTLLTAAKTTQTANAVAVEDFLDMIYACPTQFRRNGVFIMNSQTELALRKLRAKDVAGTYEGLFLWQPSLMEGRPNTFLGYPVYTQDDMPTLADTAQVIAVFGDIKAGYRIIDRVGMSLQRLTELYAEAGLVGFKIHKRVTGGVVRASQKPIVLLKEHS